MKTFTQTKGPGFQFRISTLQGFDVPVLVLLMVALPLLPLIYVALRWVVFAVLGLFALIICIANVNQRDLTLNGPAILVFLFLFVAGFSTVFSSYQAEVWFGTAGYMTGFLSHIGFVALFLLAMKTASKQNGVVERVITLWLFSAGLIALIGLMQYFGLNLLPVGERGMFEPTTSYSTIFNTNDLGNYLALAFPFAAHRFLLSFSKTSMLLLVLIYGATLTSLTRGAWLGIFVGGLVLFYLYPKKQYLVTLLITLLLVTGVLLPFNDWTLYHRVNTFSRETEKALEGDPEAGSSRFLLWQEGAKALPQSLLIGTGPDTFYYVSPDVFDEHFRSPRVPRKAHNLFLEYAVTIGIPGLLIFLLFIHSIVSKTNIRDPLHLTFLAMVIIHLVRGFFLVDVIQVYPLFWVLMGFYAGLTLKAKQGVTLA